MSMNMMFERSDEDEDLEFEEDSEQDEKGKTFSCNECGATFDSSFDFEVHLNKGHAKADAKQFHCSTCGQPFKSQSGLEGHTCKSSYDKTECHLCGRFVKHLGQHLSRFHHQRSNYQPKPRQRSIDQNRKQCSQCPKTFRSNSDRLRHEDGVHSKGRFPCEICGTILSAKSYLTIHMRRVHNKKKSEFESTKEPEESKGFDCEYCDKSYSSEHSLRRHIQVVHKKDQVCKCDVCGATFARLRSLSQHKEKVHDAEMEKGITMETLPSKSAWNKVFSRNVKAEQSVKTKSEFPKQQIIFEDLSSRDSLQSEQMLRTSFQVAPNQSIKPDYDAFQPPTSNVTFKCVNCNYKALTQMDIIKHNIFQHTQ